MANYPQSNLIRKLFIKGQPLAFGKGDVILGNDPEPNGVYYIESGYVKIYTISDDGDELLHIIYGPGELFPLVWAYLNIEPEILLYEAISSCSVWRIARDWFNHFVTTDLEISHALAVQMARQFKVYSDRVDNLEYKKAHERVAYRLLFLASRFGVREDDVISIDSPITHEAFANSINLARETVSREIESFEQEGLVQKTNSHLIIRDVPGLAAKFSRSMNIEDWNKAVPEDTAQPSPLPAQSAEIPPESVVQMPHIYAARPLQPARSPL